jgi:hypothetical protein
MRPKIPPKPHHQTLVIGYNNLYRVDDGYNWSRAMIQYGLPELIWSQASFRLPERMLLGLKRWVVLGTMCGEPETKLSRYAGGRG